MSPSRMSVVPVPGLCGGHTADESPQSLHQQAQPHQTSSVLLLSSAQE